MAFQLEEVPDNSETGDQFWRTLAPLIEQTIGRWAHVGHPVMQEEAAAMVSSMLHFYCTRCSASLYILSRKKSNGMLDVVIVREDLPGKPDGS